MNARVLRQFLNDHWGKVVGGLIGLTVGLTVIVFGFWRSLLLFACIGIGIYLGKMFDRHEGLQNVLQRFWPDSD